MSSEAQPGQGKTGLNFSSVKPLNANPSTTSNSCFFCLAGNYDVGEGDLVDDSRLAAGVDDLYLDGLAAIVIRAASYD